MGPTLLPDLGTDILIPFCALVGIAFSLLQWVYVSRVQLSRHSTSSNSAAAGKEGFNDYLIDEEEEGVNDSNVVQKCAEIQNAISEGNTTAAIGKGFAIGSAALVSLALFGAFVSRAGIATVDVLTPKVFIGLIVGAMLPYWFSAMTMKSAALKMVEEVPRQFNTIPGLMEGTAKPDYATCVNISTHASIKEMIPPGALVMLTPLIVAIFFGVETLSVSESGKQNTAKETLSFSSLITALCTGLFKTPLLNIYNISNILG